MRARNAWCHITTEMNSLLPLNTWTQRPIPSTETATIFQRDPKTEPDLKNYDPMKFLPRMQRDDYLCHDIMGHIISGLASALRAIDRSKEDPFKVKAIRACDSGIRVRAMGKTCPHLRVRWLDSASSSALRIRCSAPSSTIFAYEVFRVWGLRLESSFSEGTQ